MGSGLREFGGVLFGDTPASRTNTGEGHASVGCRQRIWFAYQ
jgi:hypothetical protein